MSVTLEAGRGANTTEQVAGSSVPQRRTSGISRRLFLAAGGLLAAGCGYVRAPQSPQQVHDDAVSAEMKRQEQQQPADEPVDRDAMKRKIDAELSAAKITLEGIIRDGAQYMTEDDCRSLLAALLTSEGKGKPVYDVAKKFNAVAQHYVYIGAGILSDYPTLAPCAFETVKRMRMEKKEASEKDQPVDDSLVGKMRSALLTAEEFAFDPRLADADFVKKLADEYQKEFALDRLKADDKD